MSVPSTVPSWGLSSQQLSVLAYNVARGFPLDTIATPRRRSRKRTYAYVLRSLRTLRFLRIPRAGRLTRIGGRNVLRLAQNPATEALYTLIQHALAARVIFELGLTYAPHLSRTLRGIPEYAIRSMRKREHQRLAIRRSK
jgi:hypothetical protein